MRKMNLALRGSWVVALACAALTGGAAWAFVPSCEKELAAAYPPLLKGDLTACSEEPSLPLVTERAEAGAFARRLNGTWELSMRTVHGINVDTATRTARLYFDLNNAGPKLVGAALLIDRTSGEEVASDVAATSYWNVGIRSDQPTRVNVSMTGQSLGGQHYALRDMRDASFMDYKNVFVALDQRGANGEAWDKVVVTERSLTYVSCKTGTIERYAKTSSERPLVDGLSIEAYWQLNQQAGQRAATSRGEGANADEGKR